MAKRQYKPIEEMSDDDTTPIVEETKIEQQTTEPQADPVMMKDIEKFLQDIDPKTKLQEQKYDDKYEKMTEQLKAEVKPDTTKKTAKMFGIIEFWQRKRKEAYDKKQAEFKVKQHLNLIKRQSFLDIKGYLDERKDKKNPGQTFMVNMELRNGMFTHFLVVLKAGYFDFDNARYIIDDEYKYYDITSKIYCLDYHQDCCLPIRRRFHMNDIYDAVKNSNELETESAINPVSLKIFMESDIIQKVMKGAEMDNWIKFVKLMLIVLTCITAITLIVLLKVAFSK